MKNFSKNIKNTCLYSYKTIYLIKNENIFILNLEETIIHVELDAQLINSVFILTEKNFSLANIKKQKFQIYRTYNIEKIEKSELSYFNFLYLKNDHHFVFIINEILYFINELQELKNFIFDSQIIESYITFDKAIGESLMIVDNAFNFYIFDPKINEIKTKIKLFENQSKLNQISNFNFLPTSEGFLLFWNRKKHFESVIIKSIENLKNLKLNKGNNNYLNSINFDLGFKNSQKFLSFYSKEVSLLIFFTKNPNSIHSTNKLNLIIYWNKSKRFNFCEIETEREIFDVKISVLKKKKIILHLLTENNKISTFHIEVKNSNSKFDPLFYKEIKIDIERNQLIKFNFMKDVFKVTNLIENVIKSGLRTINTNTTKSNQFLIHDSNALSLFVSLSTEDRERLKQETILKINEMIQDDYYTNRLNECITNIIEEKITKIFEETESKLFEHIMIYSNEMERALYEENLLSKKLEKLTEYYVKSSKQSTSESY